MTTKHLKWNPDSPCNLLNLLVEALPLFTGMVFNPNIRNTDKKTFHNIFGHFLQKRSVSSISLVLLQVMKIWSGSSLNTVFIFSFFNGDWIILVSRSENWYSSFIYRTNFVIMESSKTKARHSHVKESVIVQLLTYSNIDCHQVNSVTTWLSSQ